MKGKSGGEVRIMAEDRRRKRKKNALTEGERRRLRQLILCVVLFGLLFVGRSAGWEPLSQAAATVSSLVRQDTDFQAVFAHLGEDFARGEAVETFQGLWGTVFPREGS